MGLADVIRSPYDRPVASDVSDIRAALERMEVPEGVVNWQVETGLDSTDEPGVWVYVVVRDGDFTEVVSNWAKLGSEIRTAVAKVRPEVNTYVRFRAESETRDPEAATT